jgi:outer membrane protein, heavy metal efflux system
MNVRITCLAAIGLGAGWGVLSSGCARYQPLPLVPERTAASLDTRALADPGLHRFLRTNLTLPGDWPLKRWNLQELTLAAFYFHPSLDLARAQWGVAKAGIQTAGGRLNPVLSAVPGYTLNPDFGSPWFPMVSLDVPIETAGKRGYRIAHAREMAEVARLNILSTAWAVRSNVRSSLLGQAGAQLRADLLQEQLEWHRQLVVLLEERLQAGAAARTELTPFRISLAKTGTDHADALRMAAEARGRLAEAVGVPVRSLAGLEFAFGLDVEAEMARDMTSAEARQRALLGRADVLAGLAEYAVAEAALRLEIARQYPDLHLAPGYQFDQGQHKWSLGLSLELPVLNRNQGPIAEALAKREESAARFLSLQAKVMGEIDRALAARAAALEQLERQRQLMQLGREQAGSVAAHFQAGAADKVELVSAEIEAAASDLAYLDAQFRAQQAVGQLEDAIQRPFEKWPALEQGRAVSMKQEQP